MDQSIFFYCYNQSDRYLGFLSKNKKLTIRAFCLIAFFFSKISYSQSTSEQVIQYFDQVIGLNDMGLIEGYSYKYPPLTKGSHAFFDRKGWIMGSVRYNESTYNDVELMYDLFNQQLVVKKINEVGEIYSVILDTKKVLWFKLKDVLFEKVENQGNPEFYQIHFRGKELILMERHQKNKEIDQSTFDLKYVANNVLLLGNKESLSKFKNKKSVYPYYPDKKEVINRFIRSNKLKINFNHIEDVKLLLEHCEEY